MDDNRTENGDGKECHYCFNRPRPPAPARPSGAAPECRIPLTRAMLTKEQLEPLLPQLSRDELYELGSWLRDAAHERVEQELLQVLRAMCARCPDQAGTRATSIEFVTYSDAPDGMYWDEEVWLLADGQAWRYEGPEQRDDAATALEGRFRDLLGVYSRFDRPKLNANLTVDLFSGAFEVTPPP
ncbi:hypothetical protein [Streptomyces sp. NPDC001743]|uniref:hypothetical protein n=1 Tax=Streptomyces sp. NPDC001743 TaxID=3154397 RepID=UPI00333423DA